MKYFFLKSFLASFIAQLVMIGILLLIMIGIIAGLTSSSDKQVAVKDHSVLHIKLNDAITDRAQKDGPQIPNLSDINGASSFIGLNTILENLEEAADDPRIDGAFLDFGGVSGGMASLEEIRNGLLKFKASGKWIIAYSEGYSQGGYYLASVADEIYLYPTGGLDWRGLGGTLTFFKGFFDKFGIEMQVIRGRNNKFKSAVEPFMYEEMSEANREQTMTFLNANWNQMLIGISAERGISVNDLDAIADTIGVRSTQDAVDMGFVDELKYRDEIMALLREKCSLEEDDDIRYVGLKEYSDATPHSGGDEASDDNDDNTNFFNKDKIAVVYAVGQIESGEGDDQTIGSERISRALREARLDSSVKAIVFRVNSPGGSALASDVIWREVVLAAEEKPFIVSMGDLAASGGYYISAAAHKIYAQPTTLTGSIGVFGTLPYLGGAMEQNLGITVDTVNTNQYANLGSPFLKLSEEEYKIIQLSVEDVYATFLQVVADGRGMSVAEVDSIGQGRVWAGTDALEIGLVDELGGLDDAIEHAREEAGIAADDYRLIELPEQKDPFEEFLKELSGGAEASVFEQAFGKNHESMFRQFKEFKSLLQSEGVHARMPYLIEVR